MPFKGEKSYLGLDVGPYSPFEKLSIFLWSLLIVFFKEELAKILDEIQNIPWIGAIPDNPAVSPKNSPKPKRPGIAFFKAKRPSLDRTKNTLRKLNLPNCGKFLLL